MAQPEARLSRSIMAALRARGAWCMKIWGSEHQMSGVPDIIGCYRGRFIAVETKMPGNTTSRRQDFVIARLREAGAHVVVAQSVSEALRVLEGEVTPHPSRGPRTDELRALRGPRHSTALAPGDAYSSRARLTDESHGGDITYG